MKVQYAFLDVPMYLFMLIWNNVENKWKLEGITFSGSVKTLFNWTSDIMAPSYDGFLQDKPDDVTTDLGSKEICSRDNESLLSPWVILVFSYRQSAPFLKLLQDGW
jgi:hypothetical protein